MKTKINQNRVLAILFAFCCLMLIFTSTNAQSYLNVNFSSSANKYSLLSDIKTITFDGSGGIIFALNDNSTSTETISLINNLTFDASAGSGTALPVELVSFTALAIDNKIVLSWSTATEVNNYGFEVERQNSEVSSQKSEWVKIGFIQGHGNSNNPRNYTFEDVLLGGVKFDYRLKQIDFDGAFEYSNVVNIQLVVPQNYQLAQNYPNPFNPITVISFQLPVKSFATLKIYDILGKEVAVLVNEEKNAGSYSVNFNGSQLASGVYFSRLTAENFTSLKKMLMIK